MRLAAEPAQNPGLAVQGRAADAVERWAPSTPAGALGGAAVMALTPDGVTWTLCVAPGTMRGLGTIICVRPLSSFA
jgi:hypothetical protein